MPPSDWLDHHRSALEWIPFASIWLGTRSTDKPLLTKAFENLLMAAAAAALAIYINDKRQDDKIESIAAQVADLRAEVKTLVQLHLTNKTP